MLHHKQPQNIVLSGDTGSGKTTNYNHLISHLLYLGKVSEAEYELKPLEMNAKTVNTRVCRR